MASVSDVAVWPAEGIKGVSVGCFLFGWGVAVAGLFSKASSPMASIFSTRTQYSWGWSSWYLINTLLLSITGWPAPSMAIHTLFFLNRLRTHCEICDAKPFALFLPLLSI